MTSTGRVPIAVFVSGSGSNLQRFIDIEREPSWPAHVALVVSDKPGCLAAMRARDAGLAVFAVSPKTYEDKALYEEAVLAELRSHGVEWILLAGYMRIIGSVLLGAYPNRIVNVHPSLLPDFPGRHAVRDALEAGVGETGVTVHLVDAGVDSGPILAQGRITIPPDCSEDELLVRIHAMEHALYPETVRRLLAQ